MRRIYFAILVVSLILIPIIGFGIVNTMVSLKYETENLGDCISTVSGIDLCRILRCLEIVICLFIFGFFFSAYKLLFNQKNE